MIVSLHVATGAVGGALVRSRTRAAALGACLHLLGDRVPHQDIASPQFELYSGLALLALLSGRFGPFHRVVIGAAASSAPDVEHVVRLPRPGGRKLFPSHRIRHWHRSGGISASAQVLAAGVIAGVLVGAGRNVLRGNGN
jgi:hypothetical protein